MASIIEQALIFDVTLLIWVNGWVGASQWVDSAFKFVVSDYLVPVLLSMILFGLWFGSSEYYRRERYQLGVLASLLGVGTSNLINSTLNHLFLRARPFFDHDVNLLFYSPSDPSFPANPAVVGFALAIGILFANRWLGAFSILVALMWGFSRVFAGVNYPLDVLAGCLLGTASTVAMYGVLKFFPFVLNILLILPRLFKLI